MRFTINLATRIYLNQRLLNQILVVVTAVLLLLLGLNGTRISRNLAEQHRLDSEIKKIEGSRNIHPGVVSEKDSARQQDRVRFFNEIIERKSTDWLNLLELVEEATPEKISIAALAPGLKKGELKLAGYARSFAVLRQYLETLEGTQAFSDVLLLSHQDMIVNENSHGVLFSISCKVQF